MDSWGTPLPPSPADPPRLPGLRELQQAMPEIYGRPGTPYQPAPQSNLAPSNTLLGMLQRYPERGGFFGQLFGSLPSGTQRALEPWGSLLNPLEWTPGAAIRDTLEASGDLTRAVVRGDPWGTLAAGGGMALAALPGPGAKGPNVPPAARAALPPVSTPSERLSVEQALRLRPIAVTMNDQGVSGILRDKQFKSQFETGYSGGGLFNPDKRRQFEANYLGLPPHTPDAKRPIYGTVGLAPQMLSVRPYGDYTFLLKPEVKQRSTYTLGDSLDSGLKGKAWNRRGSGELATRAAFPYLEAQISRLNQPLLLGDVDRVLMTRPDMNAYRTLDRVGIPYDLMPHRIAQRPGSPEWVDWWRQFGLMAPPLTLGGLWAMANQGAAGEWP